MTDKPYPPAGRCQSTDRLAINKVELVCCLICGKSQSKNELTTYMQILLIKYLYVHKKCCL